MGKKRYTREKKQEPKPQAAPVPEQVKSKSQMKREAILKGKK